MKSQNLMTWRNPDTEVRIIVDQWLYMESIENQYIEHPRNFWLLWNYLKKVGIRSVLLKLKSRFSEKIRNKKIAGIGVGSTDEVPNSSNVKVREKVIFFATNHCVSSKILCIDIDFIYPLCKEFEQKSAEVLIYKPSEVFKSYSGWSPFSGIIVETDAIKKELSDIAEMGFSELKDTYFSKKMISQSCQEQLNIKPISSEKPSAVIFGLGNYVKTAILPNIRPYLSVQRVHEIDPDQLSFFGTRPSVSLDTSPIPRPGLKFDAWFIAGFHHTHTDLSIAAMNQDAYAVIEKPLSTTWDQFQRFLKTVENKENANFFLCFHKRYSELHSLAMSDLKIDLGEPIDMHCIVYEIPLPKNHWYNWPNSGSRLISNGCHWIDYFMYVNNFSPAVEYRVWHPRGSDVSVQVFLDNGAYMVMSLTDVGSQRLGVRDYIELRNKNITVKMVDGAGYEAENRSKVFRKTRKNPIHAYARMYQHIGKAISSGSKGDGIETLRSSELTLHLEDMLKKK